MGNNFLEKSVDLSKVDLIITFPGIGTYMIKEAKEINNNPTEDSHTCLLYTSVKYSINGIPHKARK